MKMESENMAGTNTRLEDAARCDRQTISPRERLINDFRRLAQMAEMKGDVRVAFDCLQMVKELECGQANASPRIAPWDLWHVLLPLAKSGCINPRWLHEQYVRTFTDMPGVSVPSYEKFKEAHGLD